MTHNKLKKIKILLLDVDGVLTRGEIIYTGSGQETKIFNVKDGFGIRLLRDAGVAVGIVTARSSEAVQRRIRELDIQYRYEGVGDKARLLDKILAETGYQSDEVAFIGDDMPDMALMKRVGLSVAVADAHETVKAQADMITVNAGGQGAVREVCEQILKAKGLWEEILRSWA